MSINKGMIVTASSQQPYLKYIDGVTGLLAAEFNVQLPARGNACAFSPDQSLLAVAHNNSPRITVYNTVNWTKLSDPATLPVSTGNGCEFSPDGSLLAVAHDNSPRITIYNTADWSKLSNPATLPASHANACAFSPDGSLLAVAHDNSPRITIYNTADWSKLSNPATLPVSNGNACTFSPDSSLLAVAHDNSPRITIYNTADWSKLSNPATLPAGKAKGCSFSPDGLLLAVVHDGSPGITIYSTVDWSVPVDMTPVSMKTGLLNANSVVWKNNGRAVMSTDGVPGVVEYNVNDGSVVFAHNNIGVVYGLAVIVTTGWEINGTIEESLAADTWIATAYDHKTGVLLGSAEFTGTTFVIDVTNPTPVSVSVVAKQGAMWIAATPYQLGDKVFSTDPVTTPYYYEATSAGTSAISEPVFPVGAGETVGDGSVTWTRIERLIEPVSQGPIIPTPK